MRICVLFVLAAAAFGSEPIWSDFETWVAKVPAFRGGQHVPVLTRYAEHLNSQGVAEDEIAKRIEAINRMRIAQPERQSVYYDAVYKLGGGPQDPIRFLVECARNLPPGIALDAAMGSGRNGLYLSSLGWKVTGYDISPEGLRVAKQKAAELGVEIETVQASHQGFDWGRDRWDLIVVSYASAWAWPERLNDSWRSLKPGGLIVCDHDCADAVALFYERKPRGFRLLRYQDIETLNEGWGMPGTKVRRVQALIQKTH
jgi:SAM-dependent methyltransferase